VYLVGAAQDPGERAAVGVDGRRGHGLDVGDAQLRAEAQLGAAGRVQHSLQAAVRQQHVVQPGRLRHFVAVLVGARLGRLGGLRRFLRQKSAKRVVIT
jgi:hypothetical protein